MSPSPLALQSLGHRDLARDGVGEELQQLLASHVAITLGRDRLADGRSDGRPVGGPEERAELRHSREGADSPDEGLAYLGELMLRGRRREAREKCPKCAAIWEGLGL